MPFMGSATLAFYEVFDPELTLHYSLNLLKTPTWKCSKEQMWLDKPRIIC